MTLRKYPVANVLIGTAIAIGGTSVVAGCAANHATGIETNNATTSIDETSKVQRAEAMTELARRIIAMHDSLQAQGKAASAKIIGQTVSLDFGDAGVETTASASFSNVNLPSTVNSIDIAELDSGVQTSDTSFRLVNYGPNETWQATSVDAGYGVTNINTNGLTITSNNTIVTNPKTVDAAFGLMASEAGDELSLPFAS